MDHEGLIRRLREVPADHPRRSEAMLHLFQEWLDAGAEWSRDETGWVIECTTNGRLAYWSGPQLWSWEHSDAVRFARKEDADRVMSHSSCQNIGARVTEHRWCAPRQERENDRCAWCGWPLADNINGGCVRGNCSQRPLPATFYDAERAFDEAKSSYTRQRIKDSVPGLRR